MTPDADRDVVTANAGWRLALIAESFLRLTGKPLIGTAEDLADPLWMAPGVIVAHDMQADPLFFYGNRMALNLFEMAAEAFVRMPSRLSAEPVEREERARLLTRVARDGFIDDYSGVRVSRTGRRFRIDKAIVWNLIDGQGQIHGQAATFDQWIPLD